MYSEKTIQNLKPDWYLSLSKKEKLDRQEKLKELRNEMWENKPIPIKIGTVLIAKKSVKSITEGKGYVVRGYFATLITTIYYSEWQEFVILKNNEGWTVKMNVNNFDLSKIKKT